jgi:hypothetical protein
MGLVEREPGDRRRGMAVNLPLTDILGDGVLYDRRSGTQRRRSSASPEDLLILFSELPSVDTDQT